MIGVLKTVKDGVKIKDLFLQNPLSLNDCL
jgi:hypothetical protein